jgi:hypothetical protein
MQALNDAVSFRATLVPRSTLAPLDAPEGAVRSARIDRGVDCCPDIARAAVGGGNIHNNHYQQ